METSTELHFCKRYSDVDRKMCEPVSRQQAESLYKSEKPFAVVMGKMLRPFCFVSIYSGAHNVNFLDADLRPYLSYHFEELKPGRLFLAQTIHREYQDKSSELAHATITKFSTDGKITVQKMKYPERTAETSDSVVDVARNWANKPPFGEYADIVKLER